MLSNIHRLKLIVITVGAQSALCFYIKSLKQISCDSQISPKKMFLCDNKDQITEIRIILLYFILFYLFPVTLSSWAVTMWSLLHTSSLTLFFLLHISKLGFLN